MRLIDTHAHLDLFAKRGTLGRVLEDARAVGVEKILTASANFDDWRAYSAVAKEFPQVSWAVGLHPTELDEHSLDHLDALGSFFADDVPPAAIGERGLDYYRISPAQPDFEEIKARQKAVFEKQLLFAKQFGCKAIIHARSAFEDCVEIISKSGLGFSNTVFHCFSGTAEEIKRLNSLGARGSFTGIITYKQADEMRAAMLAQGLEKLMLETDCPYLAPVPFRGGECEPKHVALTARKAAELFGISPDELAEITSKNAEEFFGI